MKTIFNLTAPAEPTTEPTTKPAEPTTTPGVRPDNDPFTVPKPLVEPGPKAFLTT